MFAIPLTAYFEPHSPRRVPRSGYSFVDPATEARERLVRAMEEQQAARQAYTHILAQRELARLDDSESPQLSYSDSTFDLFAPRGCSLYTSARDIYDTQATLQLQRQHELAVREKREELVRQHRLKVALAREEAHNRELLQRRQELLEAQRRQQLAREVQHRRAEIQRRAAIFQQQEEQAQAIALALAFAQEFFGKQEKGPSSNETGRPTQPCSGGCRRVRFAGSSKAPETKATPQATAKSNPFPVNATPAPVASTSSTPIRITIRETKGKASSHVRVNSRPSAVSTTPADAHAALAILSSDLDSLLVPNHVWTSDAHRRHSLNQLLEQVDAVESGGEESVRDVRRNLVRRVERAIEGLPDEDAVLAKAKGIQIREPQSAPVSVTVKDADVTEAVHEAPVQNVTAVEVEGYEVPDFMEATPATVADSTGAGTQQEVQFEEPANGTTTPNGWSSADTVPVEKTIILDDDVALQSAHDDTSVGSSTPASQFSQLSDLSTLDAAADGANSSPDTSNNLKTTADEPTKKQTSGSGSDGEEAYELL